MMLGPKTCWGNAGRRAPETLNPIRSQEDAQAKMAERKKSNIDTTTKAYKKCLFFFARIKEEKQKKKNTKGANWVNGTFKCYRSLATD
uniref:Uncharacterized protein n=1 Tax=Anguilla anguilla TaxID=7936 RepID=A0A0E9PL63_ANGAN